MKILILNTLDIQGGAARAAYRLHKALLDSGINSQMLVQTKKSDDHTVIGPQTKIQKAMGLIHPELDHFPLKFYKNKTNTLFSPSCFNFSNIVNNINKINPDIVHLHWICNGMININDIVRIKAPIVWSLHDMWAFTGGCHYNESCEGYKYKCGSCKVLGSHNKNDLSKKVFARKQKAFAAKKEMTIVGLSKWLSECARSSVLLKNKTHINLPNPIDTKTFKPFNKQKARELWNLPQDKKLILFGAINATSDPRKGFKKLMNAMKHLTSQNIELVVFGSGNPQNPVDFGMKTHYLGRLQDDISLVALYSAVDLMIVPSLQENLSNVIMESLACATPTVGFNIGGNKDMIDHGITGYLAKPFESKDLANGIEWILNAKNYDELCLNARKKIVSSFDSKFVADQYISLYKKIITHCKFKDK